MHPVSNRTGELLVRFCGVGLCGEAAAGAIFGLAGEAAAADLEVQESGGPQRAHLTGAAHLVSLCSLSLCVALPSCAAADAVICWLCTVPAVLYECDMWQASVKMPCSNPRVTVPLVPIRHLVCLHRC